MYSLMRHRKRLHDVGTHKHAPPSSSDQAQNSTHPASLTSSCPSMPPPSPWPSPAQSWLGSCVACLYIPTQSAQSLHYGSIVPQNSLRSHDVGKIARTLLPARLLNLCSRPIPHQPIMRLELLHHLMAVVNQSEPSRFASTELRAETETGYLVFVGFVELGKFLTEFVFGDIGAIGVEDVTVEQDDQNAVHA